MALGRKVTIAGTVELEFSYWPALEVSDAKIAKEPGASQPLFFNAGLARLKIKSVGIPRVDSEYCNNALCRELFS